MPSRLRRHDEYGHTHFLTISCQGRLQFFRHDSVRQVFIDGMRRTRNALGVRWIGYVVMPEHVHLMVFPHRTGTDDVIPISTVLQKLKQHVGRHGKEALRHIWRSNRTLGSPPLDVWATGNDNKPFWKTRAYDFNVTRRDRVLGKLEYMHRNPITRGLVERAEDWVWSSYRFYEVGDDSLIRMDWDGRWPMV